jgi:hypothetical protein
VKFELWQPSTVPLTEISLELPTAGALLRSCCWRGRPAAASCTAARLHLGVARTACVSSCRCGPSATRAWRSSLRGRRCVTARTGGLGPCGFCHGCLLVAVGDVGHRRFAIEDAVCRQRTHGPASVPSP